MRRPPEKHTDKRVAMVRPSDVIRAELEHGPLDAEGRRVAEAGMEKYRRYMEAVSHTR